MQDVVLNVLQVLSYLIFILAEVISILKMKKLSLSKLNDQPCVAQLRTEIIIWDLFQGWFSY